MAYANNQLKNDHYVYALFDSNNTVRYVGEGRGFRFKQKSGRPLSFLNILNDGGKIVKLKENLTKFQAQHFEEKLISLHKETLINRIKTNKVSKISYEDFKDVFVIDPSSVSGLSWKIKIRNVKNTEVCSKNNSKYYTVSYKRKIYKVHRIVWCLHNKCDLDENLVIHHVDGNSRNNNPLNLQAVSQKENVNRKVNVSKNHELLGISILSKRGKENSRLVICFYFNDDRFSKEFSLNKYSYDDALKLALNWKESKIKELENV